MSTPEAKASLQVRLRANKQGCRLYKNNSGVAYDDSGRPVFFGLGNEGKKSDGKKRNGPPKKNEDIRTPDWVGWHKLKITADMVGKEVAVITVIDAKRVGFKLKESYSVGTREHGQNKFFNIVIEAGGIAGFAATPEHVDTIINDFYLRVTA